MLFAIELTRAAALFRLRRSKLTATALLCASLSSSFVGAQEGSQPLPPPPQGTDAIATRLSGQSIFGGEERLPKITESGQIELPPLVTATTSTAMIGNGSVPKPFLDQETQPEAPLFESIQQRDEAWVWSVYPFAAANTFSHPLYFEDVMLERHGHERFPKLQPMISGARFFATVPMLPYLATIRPPASCEYKMGHFRVGDCVYPYVQRPPYVRNAAIVEAAAITGAAVVLP